MIIGYRLHVPCLFGDYFEIEKISNKAIPEGFKHQEILVSKDVPMQFFLLEHTPISLLFDDTVESKIPVSIDKVMDKKRHGFTFANYAISSELQGNIKSLYTKNTTGHMLQLYCSEDVVINLFFYKDKKVKDTELMVSEVHMNPVFYNEPLLLANKSKKKYKTDISNLETMENFINYVNKERSQFSFMDISDELPTTLSKNEIYNSEFSSSIYFHYELLFESLILNSYWLSEYQYNLNLAEFKSNCENPVICSESKKDYLNKANETNNSHTASYDYFFPTFKDWCGNFPLDMVAIYFNNEQEDKLLGQFRVTFTGNDDCMLTFVFKSILFDKESFLEYLQKEKVITEDTIDYLQSMCIDSYN